MTRPRTFDHHLPAGTCQQRPNQRGRRATPWHALSIWLCAAAMASMASAAAAQQSVQHLAALAALKQQSGASLNISRSPLTGLPTFIGTRPGHPIALSVSPSAPAESRAAAFMSTGAAALGLASDKDITWLATQGPDEVGMDHVRYRQTYNEIPVASGEIVVHLRGAYVTSVNGHTLPAIALNTTPAFAADQARATALQAARKARKGGAPYGEPVSLSEPQLEILNVGFYERRQLSDDRLAWFVEATGPALRERIWVDATDGSILMQFSQLTDARNRLVDTAGGGSSLPGTLVRSEGQGPSGDADVDHAYDYSGDTYNYYATEHGRDSFDDAGATLLSTAHWCDAGLCGSCPCQNAFWNGTQMVYGEGFAAADDVVAHELTHAVTERTANLVYCLQSGALNESFSDIFGETVDLTNGGGTDTPAVRWLLGEDVPGFGAIRNMSNPNAFGDPAKVSDSQFQCFTSCSDFDNGGVHTNSGVPNHAYALMVDGGTYNAFTVAGVGLTKAGKVEYRALTQYLTANAAFLDDYNALNQSCQDLIGTAGIGAADCTEISKALQAVELNAPVCEPTECGNGIPEFGEECDDGNTTNCDGCDANCTVTACGNGVAACGEQCDDGNLVSGDGCEPDCTLTPGCASFNATDVPQNIPDLGSITSTINVPVSGNVTDVNIVNLQGTHTYVGDLEFRLTSPANTTAVVVNNVCGPADDFALGLDDEASTPIACPPTDGLSHIPFSSLSVFDGQPAAGNWVLTVLDQNGADVGTLNSWSLLICANPCGNGLPNPGEECDDGNTNDTDGCTNHCTICGNGTTTAPEACDDGNLDDGDGCDSNCTVTGCGNGIVTAPEECDDGNTDNTDVCRNDCTLNPGLVCPGNPFFNCSFEAGNFAGWDVQDLSTPFLPLTVGGSGVTPGFGLFTSAPTDGAFAALHGFDGAGPGTIEVAQNVQLPADAASLSFDYRAGWDLFDYVGSTLPRTFEVAIQDPLSHADLARETILVVNPGSVLLDTGNLSLALNILSFAGQAVRVSFEWNVPEQFTGPAFFQLDHVQVGDTTPPPSPTPTTTSTPTITPTFTISPTPTDTAIPGDCCSPHSSSPSCTNSGCSACVCGIDPFCCNVTWDSLCANEANNECAASCPCAAAGTPTVTPTATPTHGACAATPISGCVSPGRSLLLIKDKPPTGPSDGDKLIWKWLKGAAVTQTDLGDPLGPLGGFHLCVYSAAGRVSELTVPGGGTCDGHPCWKALGSKGYKYKDAAASAGGASSVLAKGGGVGKSKLLVKGSGSSLLVPTLPLDVSGPVVVQLVRTDTNAPCWQSVFPSAVKNDDGSFKAKVVAP